MMTISKMRDLSQWGIEVLTGEADATCQRHLCDLTWAGVRLWCKVFGLVEPKDSLELSRMFYPNCNSGHERDPHVAQVMVPSWHSNIWETLAVFALCERGAKKVIVLDSGGVLGFFDTMEDDERYAMYERMHEKSAHVFIRYRVDGYRDISNNVQQGDRNIHQMSGTIHAAQEGEEKP